MWTYMRSLRGVELTETKNLIRTQRRRFLINTRCLVTNGHLLNFTAVSFTCADVTSMIDLWIWGQELFCDVKETTFCFVRVMFPWRCATPTFFPRHTLGKQPSSMWFKMLELQHGRLGQTNLPLPNFHKLGF